MASASHEPRHELHVFEQAGELVRAMAPDQGAEPRYRAHRRGVKVWFGAEKPSRFHYEAQLIPPRLAPTVEVGPDEFTVEIGFHAEHGDQRRNSEILTQLESSESAWRKNLGPQAELGPFLGNDNWGRLSEVWVEDDFGNPDLAFEFASRLIDYIDAVEPLLGEHE